MTTTNLGDTKADRGCAADAKVATNGHQPVAWMPVLAVFFTVAACAVAFLLATSWGSGWRKVAMVTTDVGAAGSTVSFDDASRSAAEFLAGRDSVEVVVPWLMTAADFLRLYHLGNNLSARRAIRERLGVDDLDAFLLPGDVISFVLTPERIEP